MPYLNVFLLISLFVLKSNEDSNETLKCSF